MKTKQSLFTAAMLIFSLLMLNSCDKEKIIGTDQLPVEISKYIATHFPENPIIQSMIELDDLVKTYEVVLQGNFTLTFSRKKEIIDIEGLTKLPDSVIPDKIRQFVAENYPENFIVGWEIDYRNQQVELDNDLDLEFTMGGDFIRIDS